MEDYMWRFLAAAMLVVLMSVGLVQAADAKRDRENLRELSADALSPGSSTKDPTMGDPNQVPVGNRTIMGTVTALKLEKRTIEIENEKGKKQRFKIDRNVKMENLEQIHDGDRVKLEVADRQGAPVATSVERQS
jgi:cold shock CspA family protein